MKLFALVLGALLLTGCSSGTTTTAPRESSSATIPITSKSPDAVARFQRGVDMLDNLRTAEAETEFRAALALDPEFVQARAYHGQSVPGPEGLKEIQSAAAAAATLPEAERVLIEGILANRVSDFAKTREAATRLTQLAPNDPRGHYLLGVRLLNDRKYAESVQSLRRATELNPKAGGAQNMLGYAALRQGDTEGAIAAFTEYARALPDEPNPQDSLGEAQLAAGRFAEAEAAFRKALELSPEFWNAWDGLAYTKFYAGDPAAASDALTKAEQGAPRPVDKMAVATLRAAIAAARGGTAEAVKILEAAERTAEASAPQVATLEVQRAHVMAVSGRAREGIALASSALQKADSGQLPPGPTINVRREALRARIVGEVRAGDAAAAEKTSAALDQAASQRADDPVAQSAMHFGRGMLAVAKADLAAARGHFDQCLADDYYCKYQGVLVAEKADDAAAAQRAREALLKMYERDPVHLIVRSQLVKPAPAKPTT
jgi:tetratricopeptide (TPR) repeat protein